MNLPARVKLREVAPRDGFQSLATFIPTSRKRQIVEAVAAAGLKEIETTSFVSPKAIPQMKDAADLLALVPRRGITHAAMVPNETGARKAVAAGADRLVAVISATGEHNRRNVRRSIDASIAGLDAVFEAAGDTPVTGAVAVAFGCPYEGEVPIANVFRLATSYLTRGADAIILADTTGMASPVQVEQMVRRFQDRFPEPDLVLHFHNNRGTAMANLLAALTAGARIFDTALGGIGGCPYVPKAAGNLPTEDVVCMLEQMGISTGIDQTAIIEAAQLLERILGYTLPGQAMKSGPVSCVSERCAF